MEAFSQDLIAGEKQPQFANVRNGFNRENGLNEPRRLVASQDRHGKIKRFVDDLGARHRVARRTAYSRDSLRKNRSVGEFNLNDSDPYRQEFGKLVVANEIHFRALAQHSRVLHPELVVRRMK